MVGWWSDEKKCIQNEKLYKYIYRVSQNEYKYWGLKCYHHEMLYEIGKEMVDDVREN